jgi:ATP-dependent exoDNAse (exonuclease V) beta subunit
MTDVVLDAAERDDAMRDLTRTYLLEAGAGTGKTKVLVGRYISCVLDPERGAGDVRTVAAITFTEKAAGELRQRVREELEKLEVAAAGRPEAIRIRAALDALDDAPISTIHGFAGRLLREFPVEARVDPAFEQLDALGSDLERAQLWQEWVTGLAAGGDDGDEQVRHWVRRLLRAGVRLDDLRKLAIGKGGLFGERYDVDPIAAPSAEPDLTETMDALSHAVQGLRGFCDLACGDPDDGGLRGSLDFCEACERVLTEAPADIDELMAQVYAISFKATLGGLGGRKDNWSDAHGGKDALWERYHAATRELTGLRDGYTTYIEQLALAVADRFTRWAGQKQAELGLLDFSDLLGRMRDLVRDDLEARRLLQRRFRYLLVDEFQDTDPLQAEIVFYLCEAEPEARDWRDVVLTPGKLFVVGDPKQSIYRFRRADIAMYDEVKDLVRGQPAGAGRVIAIEQNFRTTPQVVGWVNDVVGTVFIEEKGRQPGYQRVSPYRRGGEGSRVTVLLGPPYGGPAGSAETARRDEAGAVAALLVDMHGAGAARWPVHEGERPGAPETPRSPRWSDVAVLYRTTTGLETLEEALRRAGVPYRVDGGKTYFERREVDDALLCLRAVDDPSDGPAVYGALHSTFFGFSDDELFLYWAVGGRFDLFAPGADDGDAAVAAALAVLSELHEARPLAEPHELLAELVRRTHAAQALAATGEGGAQAVANLEQLVERARAFSGAGGGGLAAFLAWAAEAGDASGEQESQVDDEGDHVRLLTIHKAKGLEYPIVIVYGGSRAGRGGGGDAEPLVDREARRMTARLKVALPGRPSESLESPAYRDLKEREKKMADSELCRLLYVATTRARDHLVLSCFGNPLTKKNEPVKGALLGPLAKGLPAPAVIVEQYEEDGLLILPPGEAPARPGGELQADADALVRERETWRERHAAKLASAGAPARATSPSGLEHVDESVRGGGPGAPPGRARALALGSVLHRTMELCDLTDETSLSATATAAAAELDYPDLADEAVALALACWRAEPIRRAADASTQPNAVHRELAVGFMSGDVVVSGAADLLFRDGGGWVVADYKTDRVDADAASEVLLARYRPQGAAYALAAESVLGEGEVREVCFVAARAAQPDGAALVITVPVDDALRAEARREIAAAADGGRALRPDELADPTDRAPGRP